jgi:hypothetical protein
MTSAELVALFYLIGVVVGLWRVDGSAMTKVAVAIAWPLGLLAFIVTIALLVSVAAIAFPLFGVALVVLLIAAWMLW